MKATKIAGSSIDLEHPTLQFKSLDDLRGNCMLFDHLPPIEKKEAEAELWLQLPNYAHEITKEDLENNPDLKDYGVGEGDAIGIPKESVG